MKSILACRNSISHEISFPPHRNTSFVFFLPFFRQSVTPCGFGQRYIYRSAQEELHFLPFELEPTFISTCVCIFICLSYFWQRVCTWKPPRNSAPNYLPLVGRNSRALLTNKQKHFNLFDDFLSKLEDSNIADLRLRFHQKYLKSNMLLCLNLEKQKSARK